MGEWQEPMEPKGEEQVAEARGDEKPKEPQLPDAVEQG